MSDMIRRKFWETETDYAVRVAEIERRRAKAAEYQRQSNADYIKRNEESWRDDLDRARHPSSAAFPYRDICANCKWMRRHTEYWGSSITARCHLQPTPITVQLHHYCGQFARRPEGME